MIYVSRFIDIVKKIDDKVPISLSLQSPPWYKGICYPDLAPDNDNKEDYIKKLSKFNTLEILNKLLHLSHNQDPILVCNKIWQCDILLDWINNNGFDCEKYVYKKEDKNDT